MTEERNELPLNPMLRGMYEDDLRRKELAARAKHSSELEETFHKDQDEAAKKWQAEAAKHHMMADEHDKKARKSGGSKATHHDRMAGGFRRVARAFDELAGCCRGHDPSVIPAIQANPTY